MTIREQLSRLRDAVAEAIKQIKKTLSSPIENNNTYIGPKGSTLGVDNNVVDSEKKIVNQLGHDVDSRTVQGDDMETNENIETSIENVPEKTQEEEKKRTKKEQEQDKKIEEERNTMSGGEYFGPFKDSTSELLKLYLQF